MWPYQICSGSFTSPAQNLAILYLSRQHPQAVSAPASKVSSSLLLPRNTSSKCIVVHPQPTQFAPNSTASQIASPKSSLKHGVSGPRESRQRLAGYADHPLRIRSGTSNIRSQNSKALALRQFGIAHGRGSNSDWPHPTGSQAAVRSVGGAGRRKEMNSVRERNGLSPHFQSWGAVIHSAL